MNEDIFYINILQDYSVYFPFIEYYFIFVNICLWFRDILVKKNQEKMKEVQVQILSFFHWILLHFDVFLGLAHNLILLKNNKYEKIH